MWQTEKCRYNHHVKCERKQLNIVFSIPFIYFYGRVGLRYLIVYWWVCWGSMFFCRFLVFSVLRCYVLYLTGCFFETLSMLLLVWCHCTQVSHNQCKNSKSIRYFTTTCINDVHNIRNRDFAEKHLSY